MKREKKLIRLPRGKLLKTPYIFDITYSELFLTGSQPGIQHKVLKVYKSNVPVRTTLSVIAKLLNFFYIFYQVKDSFSFSSEIIA